VRACLLRLALVFAMGPASAQAQQAPPDFDALGRETAERLAEYLRVRTVNPPGNETEGARWLQQLLAREGIESEIFESSPGRGNLYARLEGTGAKRPIILLNHIDVVPATDSAWQVSPWAGETRDGYVWGRGALDMKGQGIVEAMTLIALKRRGVPLARDLIFIANADEETGSTGADWFTRDKADLIRDAEYLLNEGGSNQLDDTGRPEYYGIGVTEKIPYWVRLTARGAPGHGSVPRADNSAARLSRALGRIAAYESPLEVTPAAVRFFRDLSSRERDPRRRRWLADAAAAVRTREGRAFFTSNPYYNALLRTTISITVLHGSDKTNVIPPEATAELDVRMLPGVGPAAFLQELRGVIADRAATTSPLGGELMAAVREAVDSLDPGALVTTTMLTGFTDSWYYRNLGIGAYGVEPFRTTAADDRSVHGNDERVSMENLRFGVEFYYRIVERVAR
jgi:acetylornithine deacetylase/succinyl-diaminopimelate desuccinylase-like protein